LGFDLVAPLILFLGFWPFHHRKPATEDPRDRIAMEFEVTILQQVSEHQVAHPYVSDEYYEAVIGDLLILGTEKVADKSFDEDLARLKADLDSMLYAESCCDNLDIV
jgi:hypothetical protein